MAHGGRNRNRSGEVNGGAGGRFREMTLGGYLQAVNKEVKGIEGIAEE